VLRLVCHRVSNGVIIIIHAVGAVILHVGVNRLVVVRVQVRQDLALGLIKESLCSPVSRVARV
jgi:hypothetical protein